MLSPIDQMMQAAVEHHRAGRLQEAESGYQLVLSQLPRHPHALHMLGLIAFVRGDANRAATLIREAIALLPQNPEAFLNLGMSLERIGDIDAAQAAWSTAIQQRPNYADAYFQLGRSRRIQAKTDLAIAAMTKAIEFNPQNVSAMLILGDSYRDRGRLDESIAILQRAIELDPNNASLHAAIGNTLSDQGELEAARIEHQKCIELAPDNASYHSALVCCMQFDPVISPESVSAEHQLWNERHLKTITRNTRSIQKRDRLRIGYLSPDFRTHPVSRFFLKMLETRNRDRFEIHCYSTSSITDAMTEKVRAAVDRWHKSDGLSDEQLADQIRSDEIDILIDLALHSAHNRLLVMARKPAPVQATWLGYPGTTGLDSVDYRFSDPFLDPPGAETACTERTILLPTYWCYPIPDDAPAIAEPPFFKQHIITFGSFNNFIKVNDKVIDLWIRILAEVKDSRLLMHCKPGSHWKKTIEKFASRGITPNRIAFVGSIQIGNYFRQYQNLDIALDTFPYNGGTTTCDALYMGVPVVTLNGQSAVGRMGVSMLSHLHLQELIAQTTDEYVAVAVALASDPSRLRTLRVSMRQRMIDSPLMNGRDFTAAFESALKSMWNEQLAKAGFSNPDF